MDSRLIIILALVQGALLLGVVVILMAVHKQGDRIRELDDQTRRLMDEARELGIDDKELAEDWEAEDEEEDADA